MIIVDAHVHIYEMFQMELFFDAAYANFKKQASQEGKEHDFCPVLLLAEGSQQNVFTILSDALSKNKEHSVGRWQIAKTGEPVTLQLKNDTGEEMFLVQGRQFKSSEGLEVLGLITDFDTDENLPLTEMIRSINGRGAIPVIPWAFGKWFGKRGRVLQSLLAQDRGQTFFLGDNGGRPSLLFSLVLNRYLKKKRRRLISGSDPLPLQDEERRAGSFGIYWQIRADRKRVAGQILQLVQDPESRAIPYGRNMPLLQFLQKQLALRL